MGLGRGLYKRRRSAMMSTFGVLTLSVANSAYPILIPETLILAVLFGLLLFVFRRDFYIRNPDPMRYEHLVAAASVIFSLFYGIIGSYILRDEFHGIHTIVDSIYYTLVTYSTLGYGDIVPVTTNAKIFSCSMIIIGISSFVAALTILIGPLIEKRMRGVFTIMNRFNTFKSHVIICGYNLMSIHVAKSLAESDTDCVFIESDPEVAQTIKQQGYNVIIGDSSSETDLIRANIQEAKSIICAYKDDADNIVATMAAQKFKSADPNHAGLKIVTRIDKSDNLDKAVKAGADSVVSPAVFGGQLMAKQALS